MRLLLLLVIICFSTTVVAQMYKWTDADGKIIYSDQPNPNGSEEKIKSPPPTTSKPPATTQRTPTTTPTKANDTRGRVRYTAFSIDQPMNDEGVRENAGNLKVNMSITPNLNTARNHKIEIFLDGKKAGETASLSYQFKNMDRGTHTLIAKVVDGSGKVYKSASVTFHLLRVSGF